MIQMFIHKVALDPQHRALIFLTDEDNRRILPIQIGLPEAQAIVSKMQDIKYPRPMTHDLLRSVIEETGHTVLRVRVTRLEDTTFFAAIDLDGPMGALEIDARPSDAIALALRVGAPIYVAEEVLEQANRPSDQAEQEEMQTFIRLMGTMGDQAETYGPDFGSDRGAGADEQMSESGEG
ncbi:MAG: bifunctional nuclease family protein [Armatimonadetes bacterium]|nr:bifunctional nuclease family protein [Armatimonadota bacterium]